MSLSLLKSVIVPYVLLPWVPAYLKAALKDLCAWVSPDDEGSGHSDSTSSSIDGLEN